MIVVALALVMERVAFRPVRDAGAATLLITSFALSFLLQNVAALTWGSLPRTTDFASGLSSSFELGDVTIQKLDLVIIGVTLSLLVAVGLFFRRTTLGTQMRAAAEDFRWPACSAIRANTVVASAFALSGLLAGGRGDPAHGPDRERRRRPSASTSSSSRSSPPSSAGWAACPARCSAAS